MLNWYSHPWNQVLNRTFLCFKSCKTLFSFLLLLPSIPFKPISSRACSVVILRGVQRHSFVEAFPERYLRHTCRVQIQHFEANARSLVCSQCYILIDILVDFASLRTTSITSIKMLQKCNNYSAKNFTFIIVQMQVFKFQSTIWTKRLLSVLYMFHFIRITMKALKKSFLMFEPLE